jgi:MFS family permease
MTERLGTAARDTFRSLHVRNFRLFFAGQLVSQTGTWLTMVAQTLLVLDLTGSGVAIGLLTAFQFGPVLLLGAWAGSIADRSDKRRLLVRLQTAAMLQSLALAAVVFSGHAGLGIIYALAVVQGVITAFDNPARRAFVVEMVPQHLVPNAVSLNSTVMTGSRIVGPAAAGLLVLTVGFGWTFLIDGLSYLAVIAGLVMMRAVELHPSVPTPRAPGQVRDGLRYVRSKPDLFVPLVMMAAIGTFAFNFQVTMPLLATGPLGGTEGTFTLLLSVLSLGSMAGALWTARRTDVTTDQIVVAAAAFGVTMLLLAASPGLWAAFPAAVLLGVASIAFMTTSTSIVQMRAAPEYRGRVLALQAMVFLGSTPIGGPIVGWISDVVGPRAGVAVGGLACLAAAAWARRALAGADRPDGLDSRDGTPVAVPDAAPTVTLTD